MTVGSKLNVDGAGEDLAAGDITLHANWGTDPVLALLAGSNDAAGQISVTAKAVPGAGPTIAVAYNKAKDRAAVVVVTRGDAVANAAGECHVTASSTTGFTVTFDGTPVADEVYKFNYVVVEV